MTPLFAKFKTLNEDLCIKGKWCWHKYFSISLRKTTKPKTCDIQEMLADGGRGRVIENLRVSREFIA